MSKIAWAFVVAVSCAPAVLNAQRPLTGNVVVSNGATCTLPAPTTDQIGDIIGASSTAGPCSTTAGEYFFQTFPSGQIPSVVTYIPQVVDGGVWKTTIVIANVTASAASASLSCFQETGAAGGATQPWGPPFVEGVTTQGMSLPPGGTIFLDTPGTSSTLSQGWCAVTASDGVQAHAVFSLGSNNSQGAAPGARSSSDILVPVDNSSGGITAIAIANPSVTSQTATVFFQNTNGTVSQAAIAMQPNGHNTYVLPTLIPTSTHQRGLAEIVASANVALIALQFNATLNFTTGQAYGITNGPAIGVTDSLTCLQNPLQTGCPSPALFLLTLNTTFSLSGSTAPMVINITPGPTGYDASISGAINAQTISGTFIGGTIGGSGNQVTMAFQTPGPNSTFLGGALNITLTETNFDAKIGEAVGTVSGQLVLTQPNVGGGTINGIFTEITPRPTLGLVDVQ